MPRWPKNYKRRTDRNYAKETAYENRPEQVKRRVQRNKARRQAERKGLVRKGDGREVHHVGARRTGSLASAPTRVVSRSKNRRIQPKRK